MQELWMPAFTVSCDVEPSQGFEQRSNIQRAVLKRSLWLLCWEKSIESKTGSRRLLQ